MTTAIKEFPVGSIVKLVSGAWYEILRSTDLGVTVKPVRSMKDALTGEVHDAHKPFAISSASPVYADDEAIDD